jgi:hypothetical protein
VEGAFRADAGFVEVGDGRGGDLLEDGGFDGLEPGGAVGVSGHFKMHHLWSLQSAPPLTGVFLGFLGSFWQGVFLFP